MSSKRKKLNSIKAQDLLTHFPIILIFQHNNLQMENWFHLRSQIKQLEETRLLIVKNSIIENILVIKTNGRVVTAKNFKAHDVFSKQPQGTGETIHKLFQGPCFIIGCRKLDTLSSVWNLVQTIPNVLFLGGVFENSIICHMDMDRLSKLDRSIYAEFLNVLDYNKGIINVLQKPLDFRFLDQSQNQLWSCLEVLSRKKI